MSNQPGPQSLQDLIAYVYNYDAQPEAQVLPVFRAFLKAHSGQGGETVMGGLLPGSIDPLESMGFGRGNDLQASRYTLGALFFLSARLNLPNIPNTQFQTIEAFCRYFNVEQARLAPDRVTKLAKGIQRWAETRNQPEIAIAPLRDLLTRYPTAPGHLTTLHPIFLQTCCTTRQFAQTLPILDVPLIDLDTNISDLTYTDHLLYHYCGGVAMGALKRFSEAADFFESVVAAPCQALSAIQVEAYKKLTLIQLILYGKTLQPPKYTSQAMTRHFKNSPTTSPYIKFLLAIEKGDREGARKILKDSELFQQDNNVGLAHQVLDRMPWLAVKRLKETFMKLSLAEIGDAVGLSAEWDDPRGVRTLIVDMIAAGELSAVIHPDGTVSFDEDSGALPSKEQIEVALIRARDAVEELEELDRIMGRSREYIQKALHQRDSGAAWNDEESMIPPIRDSWDDNL